MTGVSGSGKSSLAFDTIYAEGQRRYVESLSAYARQFLERIEKPDVDVIDGIAPAVAIKQKNTTRNPRSTVATATEIYDYLRLLYARVGRTFCMNCGQEVKKDTVDEIADRILALGEGTRVQVLFPLQPPPKPLGAREGEGPARAATKAKKKAAKAAEDTLLKERLFELRKRGFNRLYQNGQVFEFSTPESLLDVNFDEPVFVLIDRIVGLARGARAHCRRHGAGLSRSRRSDLRDCACATGEAAAAPALFAALRVQALRIRYDEPEPRLFSFNNPYRRLPALPGLRQHHRFRSEPDHSRQER